MRPEGRDSRVDLAECLGPPTALITEKVVLTRGDSWEWPTTRE